MADSADDEAGIAQLKALCLQLKAHAEAADPAQATELGNELLLLLMRLQNRAEGWGAAPPSLDFESGRAYEIVTQRFGPNLPYAAVREIADQLADMSQIDLPRELAVRVDYLFVWMDQNIEELLPFFDDVTMCEEGDLVQEDD
jgi:hypothetical protein